MGKTGHDMCEKWARLLTQHRREGHFGLTPSFLLGAIRKPVGTVTAEDVSIHELRSILKSMRDHPADASVRILRCMWLQQPVAAFDNHVSVDEVPIAAADGSGPHLFVARTYLVGGPPDVETAFRSLWTTFRQPVNEGYFSYSTDDERFLEFQPTDLALIKRALGDEDA